MSAKNDPLAVLLEVKTELGLDVGDELVKACYNLQSEHQYDKDRDTIKKMKALIEEAISIEDSGTLL